MDIEKLLQKQLPNWKHLDETDRAALIASVKTVRYTAGQNVRGAANKQGAILVQNGLLRSYLLSVDGRELTVHWPKAGDVCVFSATQIADSVGFDMHIDAYEDSEVLIIPIDLFMRISKKNIYIENYLNAKSVRCLSDIVMAMEKILFTSVDKRLSGFLINLTDERKTDEIRITHEQLAGAIGSVREVVSRALKRMANNGCVELFRGGVRILDRDLLQQHGNLN